MDLEKEAKRATEMLKGKTIFKVLRNHVGEVCIECTDGIRLFVDHQPDGIELSITAGNLD